MTCDLPPPPSPPLPLPPSPRSPGGTPLTGWGNPPPTPDALRQFNQLLVDKFRNVKTPSPCYVQASPGTFESPVEI